MRLGTLLGFFVMQQQVGTITGSDGWVGLESDPDTVGKPDIAYFPVDELRMR